MINREILPRHLSKKQCQDTGMALVLLGFLIGYYTGDINIYYAAAVVHLVNMIAPTVYKPIAFIWLGLSNILGIVVSNLLLSFIFYTIVSPVGVLRRMVKVDNLQLKKWKSSSATSFKERNHRYTGKDLEKPY